MIPLINNKGEIVCSVDPKMFPLTMPVETIWGDKVYKINLNYHVDKETKEVTDKVKSVHMT